MRHPFEDNIKMRLTDRVQLMQAVEKLMQRGVSEELIPVRLARAFYVDIDELNAVLKTVASRSKGAGDGEGDFQAVA